MIFKKFIGAVTALVMTMTMFVGFAGSAEAFSTTGPGNYSSVTLKFDNNSEVVIFPDNENELSYLTTKGNVFQYNQTNYIVDSTDLNIINGSIAVTANVKEASILTITTTGNGSVTVTNAHLFNDTNNNTDVANTDDTTKTVKYAAAVGTTATIFFMAGDNSYIKTITGLDEEATTITGTKDNHVDYTFGEEDNEITVEFGTTYTITHNNAQHGTVSVIPTTAAKGDLITVITTPETGYELKDITVSATGTELDESSGAVEVTINGTNGTFEMPAYNVTVTATFGKKETLPNDVTAACVGDYTEEGPGPFASLWEGTLIGQGDTSYKPSVTVTAKNTTLGSKQLIGTTTVTGGGNIYLAIVVDLQKSDIESVLLSGVSATEEENIPEGGIYDDNISNESDTDTEEGGAES